MTVPSLLQRAEELGIGVAITDHNEIAGVIEAYESGPGVPVIPGIEVSALDGPHILIYFPALAGLADFFERYVKDARQESPFMAIRLTTEEIVTRAAHFDCLTVAAHPYGYAVMNRGLLKCVENGALPSALPDRFDAIEVICGGMSRSLNRRAIAYADERACAITGGSDAHCLSAVGSVVTCCPSSTPAGFLTDIREQRNLVTGAGISRLSKGVTLGIITRKYLPYTIPSLKVHYEQTVPRFRRVFGRLRK
jgi:predicted metal-dependent phosphoesterase TrpH